MKKFTKQIAPIILLATLLASCIEINTCGPQGPRGKAYFGIDYDYNPPYSYWDNNPALPNNPFFGEYYRTNPGVYNFEYFINPVEYWYGTYEIWELEGEPGYSDGRPGRRGPDNYLMLICNNNGFYFDRWSEGTTTHRSGDTLVVETITEDKKFRIEMIQTTKQQRTPQQPKFINNVP
ncbi:hypothetical protein [Halocola ammonii]